MSDKWFKLQNGSDIRGVAMDGIEGESINLTSMEAEKIAMAYVKWLSNNLQTPKDQFKIAIGMDSRITGPNLKTGILNGIVTQGGHGIDCGLASTPSMFMSTIFDTINCDGSIMITASHLPFNRNGMKFFTKSGGLDKADIKAILTLASEDNNNVTETIGTTSKFDLISYYANYLVDYIRKNVNHSTNYNEPLKGLNIIVDSGNGAGGFYATKVLEPLGANIDGSQFLEPDGMFPNHIPNPEDKDAMASIQNATVISNADLGIIFDTDVDRAAIVDSTGKIINRNRLIALMTVIALDDSPRTTIVTDSVTSDGLSEFIENLGGVHHRFKRGYKNVINESIRLNDLGIHSSLAIETSGHGAMKENYFLDDGAFTITKILVKDEFRVKINTDDFQTYGLNIIEQLNIFETEYDDFTIVPDNYEGIRISSNATDSVGWLLVRLSLHDPILPINIESDIIGGVKILKTALRYFLTQFDKLDLTSME
jgi:phosphomannomutase